MIMELFVTVFMFGKYQQPQKTKQRQQINNRNYYMSLVCHFKAKNYQLKYNIIFESFFNMTSNHHPSPFTVFPAALLQNLEKSFWNFNESKFSYPELSHRSQYYNDVNLKSQQLISSYFSVPANYCVLYLLSEAGFSAIPFNLIKITHNRAIYIVNDSESQFAYQQALKINPSTIKLNSQDQRQKLANQYKSEPFYTFYNRVCKEKGQTNKQLIPLNGEILVCNLNYCAHYQSVNIQNHGVVFFDSGHGFGLSGMTVVIVRKDLIGSQLPTCPDLMSFQYSVRAKSVINTPYTMVPLLFIQYLIYQYQHSQNHTTVKQTLKKIKQEYVNQLKQKTEVFQTSSEGFLKIKIPKTLPHDQGQQFGWRVAQDELVILIQQANQTKASEFTTRLFG